MAGLAGDTLASALLANDRLLVARSFKYHRPRGIVASGPEEPNALVNLGAGAFFEPNQRATTTELNEGMEAESQNRWPSLERDVGAVNGLMARFLPAGFYYKTFIHPRPFWKHVFEPFIRQSAGLGRPPKERDGDVYEHSHAHCDVLIAGGGIAGLAAALAASAGGARVILMEQQPNWGGRAATDGARIDGQPAEAWVDAALATLAARGGVTLLSRAQVSGAYDHGYVLATETCVPVPGGPRHRLWKIRTRRLIAATGAIERPLSFPGNDLPGVMLAGAVRDYVTDYAVAPGDRIVVVTNNDDAYRTALACAAAGLVVPIVIDAREGGGGPLMAAARTAGIRVEAGAAIVGVAGHKRVTGLQLGRQAGQGAPVESIACDAIAMSGGWSPVVHLWSQGGGKLVWDEALAMFRPDPERPPTGADGQGAALCAGLAAGDLATAHILRDAAAAGARAAREAGHDTPDPQVPQAEPEEAAPILPVWLMPDAAPWRSAARPGSISRTT